MEQELQRDPPAVLMNLLMSRFVSQGISCAAELRIADFMESGPRASDDIAAAIGAHPASLYRLMRMLAMAGVLTEHEARVFSLTPVGACLRSRAPGSLQPMARFIGERAHSAACAALSFAVRTGESAFRGAHGEGTFGWFAHHAYASAIFHDAMASISAASADAVVAAYDFSAFDVVADVGGGRGELLLRILEAHPRLRGVLFDLPDVVEGARDGIRARALAARCAVVGGDFFASIPRGCDAYLLKNVLHDWSDEACVKLLERCAHGLMPQGKVLVVEQLLTPPGVPSFAKILDIEMLVMTDGGRERAEEEYAALFEVAGLALTRVVATRSPMVVLEGSPR